MPLHVFVEQLKEYLSYLFLGDLCPRRLLYLQSTPLVGRTGCCELLLPASKHVCRNESQKNAHKVERDGWQVWKYFTAAGLIPHSEMSLFKHKMIFWGMSYLRSDRLLEHVTIALVGKYTKLADSYTSVIKALEHSALAINHKLEVKVEIHFVF